MPTGSRRSRKGSRHRRSRSGSGCPYSGQGIVGGAKRRSRKSKGGKKAKKAKSHKKKH